MLKISCSLMLNVGGSSMSNCDMNIYPLPLGVTRPHFRPFLIHHPSHFQKAEYART